MNGTLYLLKIILINKEGEIANAYWEESHIPLYIGKIHVNGHTELKVLHVHLHFHFFFTISHIILCCFFYKKIPLSLDDVLHYSMTQFYLLSKGSIYQDFPRVCLMGGESILNRK